MNNLGRLSVFFCGYLVSSLLYAIEIKTEFTHPVEGTPPELTVGVKGCLRVGELLYIDPTDTNLYLLTDLDGDDQSISPVFGGDESLSTLEWFLFDNDKLDFNQARSLGSLLVLTIPEDAKDKFIGFKITPKTKIGVPISNRELQVNDVTKITSINSNGLITNTLNTYVACSDDGRIEEAVALPYYPFIFEVNRFTGVINNTPISLADFHPQTNRIYELKIYSDDSRQDETTADYAGKVKWYLHEENEALTPQNLAQPVVNNEFRFKIQSTNLDAQMRSTEEESEQGLKLTVKIEP